MTMQAPSDADRIVVGTLTGLENRSNGWMRFSVQQVGKQYPVTCDTKDQGIQQQAMALVGQPVTVAIGESESPNINPNSGKPYTNRYLNMIAAGTVAQERESAYAKSKAQQPQQAAQPAAGGWGAGGAQPQTHPAQQQTLGPQTTVSQYQSEAAKDLKIMREVAMKAAVAMLPHLPAEQQSPAGLVAVSEVFVAYFHYGPARFGVQAFDSNANTPGGGSEYNPAYANQGAQQAPPQQASQQGGTPMWTPPPGGELQVGQCGTCGGLNGTHQPGCPSAVDDIPF